MLLQRSDGEGAAKAVDQANGGYANEHEGSSNLMCPDDHMNFSSGLAHNLIADKSLDKMALPEP
ncbi:hypothetical protein DCAR_0205593 [Daucus carota subsp. sativus]|uniref:Uncharacterized protein n=1 Tax=Daucus carota subsp. sativus TaxID=79200 RepID=A0A161WZQ2_DAUCS|nr:hypothetical protein DCAR_0205593 [Daucus carota subsp. sativus]